MSKKTFGERVQARRAKLGLSQGELARKAGIEQGHLSRIERGRIVAPDSDVVVKLATALDVTTDSLLLG